MIKAIIIIGRVLTNQFLGWFGRSLEHKAVLFTRGKNPIGVSSKGAIEWGDAHTLFYAHASIFP